MSTDVIPMLDDRLDRLLATCPPSSTDAVQFLRAQWDVGLAYVQFPEGYGGLDLDSRQQRHVDARLRDAGAPSCFNRNPIGFGMGAPMVMTYGSEDQKRRYLRPLFATEHIWCQLFSEPGAGSDVASLSTRAERDADEWVVNGQKLWTSLAHKARYGLLLTRTNPNVPKHAGLTYFVLDMHAPGVVIRPLRQLTGEAEFNEVFLEDVRVPDSERLGDVGAGWKAAMTTLMFERFNTGKSPRGGGPIEFAIRAWSKRGDTTMAEANVQRDPLVGCWIAAEVHRLTTLRALEKQNHGVPGPEGSVGKLSMALVNQAALELAVDLSGAHGMLYPTGYSTGYPTGYQLTRPETMGVAAADDSGKAFLRAQANSIEGGTSDIMRNILAERVLGLPGEPRGDKNIPWTDVPRS